MPQNVPTERPPFGRSPLDRVGTRRREEEFLAEARSDPNALLLVVAEGTKIPLDDDGRLGWTPLMKAAPGDPLVLLGVDEEGRPLFSREMLPGDEPADGIVFAQLREAGHALNEHDAACAVQAVALTTWHRRAPYCVACGAPTSIEDAGHVRRCPSCGASHFPRTDPAVIMLVSDGDRCVLGRRVGAPEGRWSTLAGFVEAGESLETAVAREVREEVGLVVTDVHYRGSQPWPFPAQLMVAFDAEAEYAPLTLDEEHSAVRWFEREELAAGIASGEIAVPGPISAGAFLIRSWLGPELATW